MSAVPLDGRSLAERGGPARPDRVRIVHLGLGNFHRAHQAWYTAHATDAADWGIAAFTGRSPQQAELLQQQDGLYCLVVRGEGADRVEVVPSILEAHDASRLDRLVELLADPADPAVAIVTLTVTEAGYRLAGDGLLDRADAVTRDDIAELTRVFESGRLTDAAPQAALSRLLVGLEARRRAGGAPIAIVPCDNIPDNGSYVGRGLQALAAEVSPELAAWIASDVSFVGTSVDRITPRIEGEVDAVAEAGWIDRSPVVTEPFADWVLSGAFPAGRPAWETSGARFVDDLEPWENRKLWLLNGAHSILAFAGLARGHETVSVAIADPACRALVEDFWDEAAQLLPAEIETVQYRRDLLDRFANPRIVHRLSQIAGDATTKVRYRFAAVAERTLARGGEPTGSAGAIAAWLRALRLGVVPGDAFAADIRQVLDGPAVVTALIDLTSPRLAAHDGFAELVAAADDPTTDPHPAHSAVPASA
ncbi:mannitol dehydrogenase family protein [Microbacterium sp. SS28]|uniref:mannitol dehydrogenase family protein n=1 Tax=Microbacterium sp. SS28 TaxID=2919948 RepID=UPI001FAA5DB6|nr:mannitol dehydrogenase family protein [Microbacterium sp. SS28]